MRKARRNDHRLLLTAVIAICGVVIALLSLGVAIESLRLQYAERLSVEVIGAERDLVHVLSVSRSKGQVPAVSRIAVWRTLAVTNRSNKPVSLVSVSFTEGSSRTYTAIEPFWTGAEIYGDTVLLTAPVELPTYLYPGETRHLHMLFPVAVPKQLGAAVFKQMQVRKPMPETVVGMTVSSLLFFDHIDAEGPELIEKARLLPNARIDTVSRDYVEVTRTMFDRRTDRTAFIDATNTAQDGFVAFDGLRLFARLIEVKDWSNPPNIEDFKPDYRMCIVDVFTGSGGRYQTAIDSRALPLYSYADQILRKAGVVLPGQ